MCKQVCGNPVGCSDIAYAKLVMELLPSGISEIQGMFVIGFLDQLSELNHFLPVCLSRSEGFNDGCDVGCSHVLFDLHIQQFQHHFHHGLVEKHPPHCLRVGAHDCGKV